MFYIPHRQRTTNSEITQCMQNTYENDWKMAVCVQSHEHNSRESVLTCSSIGNFAASPACTNILIREELERDQNDCSSVDCLSTQHFLCMAYLQRCLYVYKMNIHCAIFFCKLCGVASYISSISNQHVQQGLCVATLLLTPKLPPFQQIVRRTPFPKRSS